MDGIKFNSWHATRYKPKMHDDRRNRKIEVSKGNYQNLDTFEKIRRHQCQK